jgi:outer membrane protein assembly factor BamD (BamD/ComL family)
LIENGEKEIEKAADNKKALKKILSAYKGTPVADKAKAALEKLAEELKSSAKKTKPAKKDQPGKVTPGKKAGDDMFSPAMLLKRAEEYYRNEAYEPVRNVLGRIIREYPDSKEAKRAKYLLKKIEEEGE